jgi:hypothetical protein
MGNFRIGDKAQRAHNDLQGALIALGGAPTPELSSGALVLAARIHIKNTRPEESKAAWMDRCERMWEAVNAEEAASAK